jgi:hypothetical protein
MVEPFATREPVVVVVLAAAVVVVSAAVVVVVSAAASFAGRWTITGVRSSDYY